VVRLGPQRAPWAYVYIAIAANVWVLAGLIERFIAG
jgi:hypothetical protein